MLLFTVADRSPVGYRVELSPPLDEAPEPPAGRFPVDSCIPDGCAGSIPVIPAKCMPRFSPKAGMDTGMLTLESFH